jgi:anti-sigma B factor antagonist
MAHELTVEVISEGRELTLCGRLDSRSANEARSILHAAVACGCGDLLVHVGELEIWDASGLGVIVGAHRKARGLQRRLVLTDVPPRQLRLLRATRLHRMLIVEPAVA